MDGADQGVAQSNVRGAPVATNPSDETTPLIPPTAPPPTYQATGTGDARLPSGGQGNELGERRDRAPARGHIGHSNRSDRRTPASSATAGPTRAPVPSVQIRPAREPVPSVLTRPTPTTGVRPERRRAKYKPALYCSLFIIGVLISVADLFIGVWMRIDPYKQNDEIPKADEIAQPDFFLLMGGMEGLFIVWHVVTLKSILCCRPTICIQAIYWMFRFFHLGAFLLFALSIVIGVMVWPNLPNVFLWNRAILYLFLSMMANYITLVYWAVELTVDFCKSLDW